MTYTSLEYELQVSPKLASKCPNLDMELYHVQDAPHHTSAAIARCITCGAVSTIQYLDFNTIPWCERIVTKNLEEMHKKIEEQMKTIRINVNDEHLKRALQQALFDIGYEWFSSARYPIPNIEKAILLNDPSRGKMRHNPGDEDYEFTYTAEKDSWNVILDAARRALEPEEPKGQAWVKTTTVWKQRRFHYWAFLHSDKFTKAEAEEQFGDRLLCWIPESEV